MQHLYQTAITTYLDQLILKYKLLIRIAEDADEYPIMGGRIIRDYRITLNSIRRLICLFSSVSFGWIGYLPHTLFESIRVEAIDAPPGRLQPIERVFNESWRLLACVPTLSVCPLISIAHWILSRKTHTLSSSGDGLFLLIIFIKVEDRLLNTPMLPSPPAPEKHPAPGEQDSAEFHS